MANMIVTGGAGFIGSNFVRHWRSVAPDDAIVVLDILSYAGHPANLDGLDGVTLIPGDICDTPLVSRLIADHAIDTIVHFAAETHVDRSITGPDAFVTTNVVGTHSLLKAAKTAWLDQGGGKPHRFHHVSTDEVYGTLGADDLAFSEVTPYAPNSPYAASKASSDHLVRAYHHTYGLETTTSNCSNNYGPFQFPEKLVPLFILNALSGKQLPIYGDGKNVRDWLHVADHCQAIERILRGGRIGETYNIGGGQELPNFAVVDEICRGVDAAFAVDATLATRFPAAPAAQGRSTAELKSYVEDRKGHDRRYAIDASKIHSELGYVPARDFPRGFADTLAWYLAGEQWWKPLLARAALAV
ncbi:dTDP-glucose 4,6-dehydratase [Sphingomonas sp. 10B4]|uniref:dTDP-glucose 4,6-dehydratase n=1 Tax=Sphingomonas sp. 10B4 TaxID=3048575 RepID=UPI002AB5CE8E|nr:dTDP-glucose 4,6-dehydratase [Sphingomonas sp. 10B4]MDY7523895.1 dTDP-glucose 4,6-dehydratase [Sphingomonas sp. 10B4]MEB0284534.1 dTDP-glucose 4,6-dehydratase [Sphingomonas sp. 10B4]